MGVGRHTDRCHILGFYSSFFVKGKKFIDFFFAPITNPFRNTCVFMCYVVSFLRRCDVKVKSCLYLNKFFPVPCILFTEIRFFFLKKREQFICDVSVAITTFARLF